MVTDSQIQKLLVAELEVRKKRNPQYSLRAFALSLGVSPAQLSQIISGRRNITIKSLQKISQGLGLAPSEVENYLKDWSLQKLDFQHEDPKVRNKKNLLDDEFKLVSEWYHFAILSLVKLRGASTQPEWIAAKLGISERLAEEAVRRLQRLKILAPGSKLLQICPPLSVVSDVPSHAIRSYHNRLLNLALEGLEKSSVDRRDYSAMTFAIHPKNLHRYRALIEAFQDELVKLSEQEQSQEVYVFSSQLFPLMNPRKDDL